MHYRLMPLWLLLLSSLLFSTQTQASILKQTSYPNGVRLIVEEDHASPVAMVQIWLKVGGRDEVPGKTGLAHVFEHMMFKGSNALKAGEYSKKISAMGGNDNAFTSTDYTAYFETIPAARVDEVIAMEAERFAHLTLDADEFSREIRVIMEERRMRTEDDPNSQMFEELSAASLRLHPYRNPVIGWMQDLEQLSIEDVRSFYHQHYIPGNVTVVIVGDVEFAQVKKVVANTFGKMRPKKVNARFNPEEPKPLGPKRVDVYLAAQLPILAVVLPVPVWKPGENDQDAAAIAVATYILAGGRSARMQKKLVDETRLAFSVAAGYDPFGMGLDLWYAYGALRSDSDTEAFESALWAMIGDLQKEPVSASSLKMAKRNIVASEVFARDSLYLRAKRIGRLETVGIGADNYERWLDAIRNVSAEDIQRVITRWFRPNYATTGILHVEQAE